MSKSPTNPRIIWLASYPRSGNTWLRFLLANLLVKDVRSSRQVEAMIPNLTVVKGQKLVLSPKQRSLVATQWPYDPNNDLFKLSAGFIYVVRNPRDVMRSLFDFNRTEFVPDDVAENDAVMASVRERYVQDFIESKGHPVRGRDDDATDWIRHVENWRRAADTVPGLFIRYEDLLADTKREMERICTFLGAAPSDAVIDTAVAKSTLAAMKTMEEREVTEKKPGIFYRPSHDAFAAKGIRVLGKGTMDDTTLSAEQNETFVGVFGDTMASLGYSIDPGSGRLVVFDTAIGDKTVLPAGPELVAPRFGMTAPQSSVPSDLVET